MTARGNLHGNTATTIIRGGPSARTYGVVSESIFETPLRSRWAHARSGNVWLKTKNVRSKRIIARQRVGHNVSDTNRPFHRRRRQGYRSTASTKSGDKTFVFTIHSVRTIGIVNKLFGLNYYYLPLSNVCILLRGSTRNIRTHTELNESEGVVCRRT